MTKETREARIDNYFRINGACACSTHDLLVMGKAAHAPRGALTSGFKGIAKR